MVRVLIAALAALLFSGGVLAAEKNPPNVVVIFIDDMGYADIAPFGCKDYATPNLSRMASEGRILTDFHSATAVCSASRAALLTGCYPERVSILGALFPKSRIGLHTSETTIAEICKSKGYATAVFGKWHLGHHKPFLPLQHGFDEWLGLPYSNDMWPWQPGRHESSELGSQRHGGFPHLPLYEGNSVVDADVSDKDQAELTTKYTERAVEFIRRNRESPFFLYVPHTMVHVPLFVSEKFRGTSGAGLYGDVVMEIDWSVGRILNTLEETGVDKNTLVCFTSDNGPWLNFGNHAGSAGPLREGKGTMFEGGYRVPCIAWWPGRIPAGSRCDELASTMDLLPTVSKLIGAELPERKIDGKDIGALLWGGEQATSPHDCFYCYYDGKLQAVRDRRWKLHFPHSYRTLGEKQPGKDGIPVTYEHKKTGHELYDLHSDIGETKNVAAKHPDVVARLTQHAEEARSTLGDILVKREGNEVRPAGRLP